MIILVITSCDKGNLPPVARLTSFPPIGDSMTLFEFSAGESADDRNYQKGLVCRWDIQDDGQWDTEYNQSKTLVHQYVNPGIYSVAVEVKDLDGLTSVARDTIEVLGMNQDIDTLEDSRDNNRYRIVKIRDRWWMAENVRFGLEIPVDRIQTNNGIVEMYRDARSNSMDSSGGVYHWLEAMNYQVNDPKGICPDGWHIPTREEWVDLFKPYPYLYALKHYGKDGLSNLNLDLQNGAFRWTDGTFWWAHVKGYETEFWTSSYKVLNNQYRPYGVLFASPYHGLLVDYSTGDTNILEGGENVRYTSVRCIRNKQ
jgi:uncharacterized protein (TIGR02145 family)